MPDCLMTAQQFLENLADNSQPIWLLGEGLVYHKDKFKADGICFLNERYWNPRAENVYKLGWQKALACQFADPLTLQPTYLRRPDIKEKLATSEPRQ
jgi:tRNA A37 threonylcarbamoyladenosine modification protein TsaB